MRQMKLKNDEDIQTDNDEDKFKIKTDRERGGKAIIGKYYLHAYLAD